MSEQQVNVLASKIISLLGMTFVFGLGFLFAFHLDSKGSLGLNEISFWQAQLIAFLILGFNVIVEKGLSKICNRIKNKKV